MADSGERLINRTIIIGQRQVASHNLPSKVSSIEGFGGFEHNFVEKIHERFICTICTKVMKDPYLVVCCGKKFCSSCLKSWFKKQHTDSCPHCRATKGTYPFLHVLEKGMKSEIESFHILCSNNNKGCKWIGELRELNKHFMSDKGCPYYELECPNKCLTSEGITTLIIRNSLQDHLYHHCELRQVYCQYCNHIGTMKSYPSHKDVCKMFPMPCPNNCGEQGIVRQTVTSHQWKCKFERITCKYVYVGCTENVRRQDMPQHMIDYQGVHLEMMTNAYDQLQQELDDMKMELTAATDYYAYQ